MTAIGTMDGILALVFLACLKAAVPHSERPLRGGDFSNVNYRLWPIAPYRTATARCFDYADSVPPESLESIRWGRSGNN